MGLERFEGKSAIVTGAASGIGRATVARLVAEGAQVLGTDVEAEGLKSSIDEANADAVGGQAFARVADISAEGDVAATIADAVERFGKLDVLANIAGIMRTGRTESFDLATWDLVLRVNLTGTFLMCRDALPHLVESKGAIVNTASTSSFFGHPWMAAYASSKGAIAALTQTLAVEYAKAGVRVNAVAPGSVTSGITSGVEFPDDLSKEESKLLRRIMSPTGFGDPGAVAAVVAMLASDDGRHMTGEVVRIDGGTHA
jgi:meso-butanediol dehydrogenase/(S,S)-butanediol dehydrogenase/diacetyl reductase